MIVLSIKIIQKVIYSPQNKYNSFINNDILRIVFSYFYNKNNKGIIKI